MYVAYPLRVLMFPGKADVYTATTNPFAVPALVRLRIGKKKPTVFLVYDLFPDALELSGLIKRNGVISKLIGKLTQYAIRSSSIVVFLSEGVSQHAQARYGNAKESIIIPVGADGRPFRHASRRCLMKARKFKLPTAETSEKLMTSILWPKYSKIRSRTSLGGTLGRSETATESYKIR